MKKKHECFFAVKGDPNIRNFLPTHPLTLIMFFPGGYPPSDWENEQEFHSFVPRSISQTQIPLPPPLRMHMKLKCEQDSQHSGWNDPPSPLPKNMQGMYGLCSRTPCPCTPSLLIPMPQPPYFDLTTREYLHGLHPLPPSGSTMGSDTQMIQEWIKTISTDSGIKDESMTPGKQTPRTLSPSLSSLMTPTGNLTP
ncbi:hypothetical protein DFS33DRAFT_1380735 [Desarmillaria ectypa]|nr:hypothetical protein DFS33DRAFT_1380735 [Desarmillaria ectypa]